MGDGEIASAAAKLAAELDPASVAERRRRAEEERRVTLRPAPDVMSQLSALLPVKDGVSVFAALKAAADTAIGQGDPRTRGQVMADTLVDRVTGRAPLADGADAGVTVDVVVPDTVLSCQSDAGTYIAGYGPIPADLARDLAAGATWMRRRVPPGMATFLRLRDRTCRTPWCDAPVRHSDHVESVDEGGPTSTVNTQGPCQACNHAKQALGWTARPRPGPHHCVETTTPTGHSYTSIAPPARARTWVETEPGTWELIA